MKAVLFPGDKKVDVVDRQSRDTSTRDTTFESRYGTTGNWRRPGVSMVSFPSDAHVNWSAKST